MTKHRYRNFVHCHNCEVKSVCTLRVLGVNQAESCPNWHGCFHGIPIPNNYNMEHALPAKLYRDRMI